MSFSWVPYYNELASKLLEYKDNRNKLVKIVYGLNDEYIDFLRESETKKEFDDIHPFVVFAIFSRLFLIGKKQTILEYFKKEFDLKSEIPVDFDGIPSINPQKSFWGLNWFKDDSEMIKQNWDLFEIASAEKLDEERFIKAFDLVIQQNGAKWNVTHALFRAFPDKFLSLDENSRNYLTTHGIQVMKDKDFNGKTYLELSNLVKTKLNSKELKDENLINLSHNSWLAGNEAVNYWLIAPGENAWDWDSQKNSGIIAIGWDDIGDISKYENDFQTFQSDFKEIFKDGDKDKTVSSKQVWNFYKEVNNGDIVFARKGLYQIIGMGTVTSDYYYDGSRGRYTNVRKVNWEKIGEWNYPGQSTRNTVHKLKLEQAMEIIKTMNEQENEKTISLMNLLKTNNNLILHGAPGTGKTYTAKDIAAQMICGKAYSEIEAGSEEEKLFNEHTEFVQFHPSYDYSDFVEGLRPIEGENSGDVGFERKDGVFKEFCNKALTSTKVVQTTNFDDSWDNLIEDVRKNLAENKLTKIGSWDYGLSTRNSLKYSSKDSPSQYNFTITKQNVFDAYSGKKARPAGGFQKEMLQIVDFMKEKFKLKAFSEVDIVPEQKESTPYIFIIDEINRGEMSKIFGELFYSIDPDYRGTKGKVRTQYANMLKETNDFDDALQITTSFGHFFVPENVYIIGTMNDIDRSVDSMDFAMRRRFTFVELKANECLGMLNNLNISDGITKSDILARMTVLNKEIEKIPGLSSSYHIGGSYFAKLSKYSDKSKNEAFENLWNNHLKPLITDYLRGLPNMEQKLQSFKEKYDEAGTDITDDSAN